jgi:hypothetical protein
MEDVEDRRTAIPSQLPESEIRPNYLWMLKVEAGFNKSAQTWFKNALRAITD